MSKLAFTRFKNRGWLTSEELALEDELVRFIEEEENAQGVECDFVVSKMSDEELKILLEAVRQRLKSKRKSALIADKDKQKQKITIS
jgi:hypothetical protein